jgi:cytochrome b561
MIYPTWVANGSIAALLVGFIILHVLAAFYHQFVRKDGLFRRMSLGGRGSDPSAPAE